MIPWTIFLEAYTPFWDPIEKLWPSFSNYGLWTIVPLVLAIAIICRGTKVRAMRDLPRSATWLAAQILVVMALLAGLLFVAYWGMVYWAHSGA